MSNMIIVRQVADSAMQGIKEAGHVFTDEAPESLVYSRLLTSVKRIRRGTKVTYSVAVPRYNFNVVREMTQAEETAIIGKRI